MFFGGDIYLFYRIILCYKIGTMYSLIDRTIMFCRILYFIKKIWNYSNKSSIKKWILILAIYYGLDI